MLLNIHDLSITFPSGHGTVQAVKNVSLHIAPGETLGLVGESGSGKSVTALSIMGLLPHPAQVSGNFQYTPNQKPETSKPETLNPEPFKPENHRGKEIAMIFQEPMTSLNPVFRCGYQVTEAIRLHQRTTASQAREQALVLFEKVKFEDPERIFRAYPHELSGGQKQRVMIAMALAGQPRLLIADEPTTALDVTVQKTILDLLQELRADTGLAMLFISHDLGVISEIADRVLVMRQGQIVETGSASKVLENPEHPYTRGLLACRPSLHQKVHRLPTVQDYLNDNTVQPVLVRPSETAERRADLLRHSPLLEIKNVSVHYPVRRHFWETGSQSVKALQEVSFEVFPGEIFGLAGESGCGKTTLGRVISRLLRPSEGSVWYRKLNLETLPAINFRPLRREIQMVFQDPYSSLNPRMPIGEALLEGMRTYQLHGSEQRRREMAAELLKKVGLEVDHARRLPHEFSGGQRQRICLARALALQPKLLVCDEVVSALDVSVQADILNLLLDLQRDFGLTYLFISHDLSVIRQMCDRVLVMHQGRIEALGHPEVLFENPENEYVRALLEAVPGK
ncbi:MAG: ABC transporter ATP-binding protein [Saprospiraceae bacterium]